MSDIKIEFTDNILINTSGLAKIGQFLNDTQVFSKINRVSKIKKNSGIISDYDMIKTQIALICLGKTDFEAVEQYRNDKFFKKALKLKRVPSSPSLRQRIETYGKEMCEVIREINIELLKDYFIGESVQIGGQSYIILDSDVTPMDNSGSKKELVELTYRKFNGYSPMMSYAGTSGFMINNELRSGSSHTNCEGTLDYFGTTISLLKQLSDEPVLAIMDSGNDDRALVRQLIGNGADCLIKRNLRREPAEKYINYCKEFAAERGMIKSIYPGCRKYYVNWELEVQDIMVPISVVMTEKTTDSKGQTFMMPEIELEVYWNTLKLAAEQAEEYYHQHGTSEQYHSEFKTDLDMERLPSGKFSSNYIYMLFGMLSFNLLRITGKSLMETGLVPGKRGKRLRIRTILQNVMYMAGQFISHARSTALKLYKEYLWTPSFAMIMK